MPGDSSTREHAQRVTRLFSHIAWVYDLMNTVFSFGLDRVWRKRLVRQVEPLSPSSCFLDLAAGTMEVTVALAKQYPGHTILAADFCFPMLQKGVSKLSAVPTAAVYPLVADGRFLPLPDASVHAITIAFGLRNIKPRADALAEAVRVLVPGGKLCILEFGSARDRILFGVYNFYLAYVLPFIGRLVVRDKAAYQHLADSIASFPSAAELADEMRAAGFGTVNYQTMTAGIVCLHEGVKA